MVHIIDVVLVLTDVVSAYNNVFKQCTTTPFDSYHFLIKIYTLRGRRNYKIILDWWYECSHTHIYGCRRDYIIAHNISQNRHNCCGQYHHKRELLSQIKLHRHGKIFFSFYFKNALCCVHRLTRLILSCEIKSTFSSEYHNRHTPPPTKLHCSTDRPTN